MDEMFSLRMNERGCQCKAALFLCEENPALDAGLVIANKCVLPKQKCLQTYILLEGIRWGDCNE